MGVAPPPGRPEKSGKGARKAPTPPSLGSTLSEKLCAPLPHGVHPVIGPRPTLPHSGPGQARAGHARRAPATPEALAPGEGWGFPRRPRAEGEGKEGFATIPLGGGSRGGSGGGGGGGWRRRQRQRRRCPGTPPPIVPSPGQARPRTPHRPPQARRPRPAPRAPRPGPRTPRRAASPYLAAPGSPPVAKATYPRKARAGPGNEPTDKK
ncbi:uncharacterized protein LOC128929704 [Callithrix jacchus]